MGIEVDEVKKEIQKRKVSDIIFDESIYARIETSPSLVDEYSRNIEEILKSGPKIKISKDNKLIDGYHRWLAIEKVYGKEFVFEVEVHLTTNSDYIELESYSSNTRHGKRSSKKDNERNIRRLYAKGHELETIQEKLGLSVDIVYEATVEDRKKEKEERNDKILELHLRAQNTLDNIIEQINEIYKDRKSLQIEDAQTQKIISDFMKSQKIRKCFENFKPHLYNIWNLHKADKETKHFGYFPEIFMANLLYYHTEPFDIVLDPFVGSGTTVDICKKYFRRYYCSDMQEVETIREKDIKKWKIQDGLPDNFKGVRPNLVFLDPPYWWQAKGRYSDSKNDLANMSLPDFYSTIEDFLKKIITKKPDKIAIVISPTQFPNKNHEFEDHIFKFHEMLVKGGYRIEMRYQLPYSTQQYKDIHVNIMKEEKKCISIVRDLVVWKR